ncbi:MAG: type II secretion system protein GspG [Planctomycetaceae bacterium]|nr:type II secretion system protein GspG [Planctomycetaceae bacterium]
MLNQLEISNTNSSITYQPISDFLTEHFANADKIHSEKENSPTLNANQNNQQNVRQNRDSILHKRVYNAMKILSQKMWNADSEIDDMPLSKVIQWLEANEKALDEFGKAIRFPVYYAPMFVQQYNDLIYDNSEYKFHREIIQGSQVRIMYNLNVGNFEKAKYDAMTIIKFANMQMRYLCTSQKFFHASETFNRGIFAVLDIIRFGNLTKEQLEQLQQELQQHRAMPTFADLIFIARMENINIAYNAFELNTNIYQVTTVNKRKKSFLPESFHDEIIIYFLSIYNYFGWTPMFIEQQLYFDSIEQSIGNKFSQTRLKSIEKQYEKSFFSLDSNYKIFTLMLRKGLYRVIPTCIGETIKQFAGDLVRLIIPLRYKIEAMERLLNIAIALEFYRFDHGTYPQSLNELNGKYIDVVPDDPFSDNEPFQYQLEFQPDTKNINNTNLNNDGGNKNSLQKNDSGYLLYSVGFNGKDDKGVGHGYNDHAKKQISTENNNAIEQKKSEQNTTEKSRDDIYIRKSKKHIEQFF